ncbi:MAG TPA: tRNA lysidine(34) synthetase TilS [Candidatus Ozemobacteraceae bacterium]|nr:tRNA lysidine(34) synthetase TilS [Candidatus Ozemobacteraceae bacterium]
MRSQAWKKKIDGVAARLPGKRIGVAVSGGGDSVALVRMLQPLHETGLCTLVILHVDHGWRPESGSEAEWVRRLAGGLNMEFFGVTLAKAVGNKINEASARAGRLAAFARAVEERALDAVALGHTSDDQVETLLMRIIRGTSLQGLGGIRERRRVRIDGKPLTLWRPLLAFSRAELRGFLGEIGQEWLEDPSNASSRFLRNRIRNELVPFLETLRPGIAGRICPLAEDLQSVSKLVRSLTGRCVAASDAGAIAISPHHPDFLLREILHRWLISRLKAGEPSRALLDRLAELVRAGACGRGVPFRDRMIVRTRDGLAVISSGTQGPSLPETILKPGLPENIADWIYLVADKADSTEVAERAAGECQAVWINDDIYPGPFVVRTRAPGDRFRQAGGMGEKRFSRWLIDRHIPRHLRNDLVIVVCGRNVVWIPGLAVADGVKTSPMPGWRMLRRCKKAP